MINHHFPEAQPRVIVPQLVEDGRWPHVEGKGILCLPSPKIGDAAGDRIFKHICLAIDLLNFDGAKRQKDFRLEFATYWGRTCGERPSSLISLVTPNGPSREIFYYKQSENQIVFGDDRKSLTAWLQNAGNNPGEKQIQQTWMTWWEEPPLPPAFPQIGRDVLQDIPEDFQGVVINHAGKLLPILLGPQTETGSVLVAVLLKSPTLRELSKGFRNIDKVPKPNIIRSISAQPLRRCIIQRADGAYVHGRDHGPDYAILAKKTVAVVGCGAIGASVARLLAQAGVGNFILIDQDELGTQNISRHILGYRFVGQSKTKAVAKMLREDFPHIHSIIAVDNKVEEILRENPSKLTSCDLIISAGIDFTGDAALDRWRTATAEAPVHLCTWTEAYALSGHAIALFGVDRLLDAFDKDGQPKLELVNWPLNTIIVEAGCGNVFQPHGAIDLQSSIILAAGLALDVLNSAVKSSCRRTWQGNRDKVLQKKGIPSHEFTVSNIEKSYGWPPVFS